MYWTISIHIGGRGGTPFLDATTSHSSAENVHILTIFCISQHCIKRQVSSSECAVVSFCISETTLNKLRQLCVAVRLVYGLLKWSSFFGLCPSSFKVCCFRNVVLYFKKLGGGRSAKKQDYVGDLTKCLFRQSATESVFIHILLCREFHGDLFDEICCLLAAVFIARYLMNYYSSTCTG